MTCPTHESRHTPVCPDAVDLRIINHLQAGFPLCSRPFGRLAPEFGLDEHELIERIGRLLDRGVLTRFGPLFQIENVGGAYCLAAMSVPEHRWDQVLLRVNRHPEVAHNYRRDHALNMWFVLATERPEQIAECIANIERETGLEVLALPKEREYFLEMKLEY